LRRTTALLALVVVTLVGCTPPEEEAEPPVAADTTAAMTPEASDALRLLFAVVVLVSGDVDAALAEGIVTPAELDRADRAIVEGQVDELVRTAAGPDG
jgi:hypothetical protein